MIGQFFSSLFILFLSYSVFGQSIPAFDYGDRDTIDIYYNLNQKLRINFNKADPSLVKIRYTTPRGVNVSQADSSMYIFVNAPIESMRLKLYYKNLPVDIIDARIERMPATNMVLNTEEVGIISKQKLSETKSLAASIPNRYREDLNLQIYSYNLRLLRPGKNPELLPCFNESVSDQIINKIIGLPEHSIIMIENVRLRTPQNNVIELEGPGLTYEIKS